MRRTSSRRAWSAALTALAVAVTTATMTVGGAREASAAPGTDATAPVAHDRVVSDVPAPFTPQVKDGRVLSIAQVGTSMVVGGTFSQVSAANGSGLVERQRVFAFNAATGAITGAFAPTVNGDVTAVFPGPTAGTVYVAGSFSSVNGVARRVALLDVATGATVSTFRAPGMNGAVRDIVKVGNRLYVAGNFTAVGGVEHRGLATLNASTGALDPFVDVDVAVNHNWYEGSDGARGAVGVAAIAVSPDARRLVAIGNFKEVDGLPRDQAVMLDLSGDSARVEPDWRTTRYEPACFSNSFDSYVRDVDFAPDGSYFVIVSTGGPNPGTLCDTVAKWATSASGDAVEPVWVDDTGGDTLFSVAATGAAVYSGGHQRWMNNAGGRDRAAPGSVPRPGLAANDPVSGVPLSWNPGRHPRGVGAFALQPTAAGLWVGSDTTYIGNFEFWRPRLAFFPLTGGVQPGAGGTVSLPANVYLGSPGVLDAGGVDVLHRVNAGGPGLLSLDGGPDWEGDQGGTSPYRNSGSNAAGWTPVPSVDSSVPLTAPRELFDSERWDPGSAPEMSWEFPVPEGEDVEVRIYLANRCTCTASAGQRVFDVAVEGQTRLQSYDIVADVGHDVGTMKSYTVTSDGVIDIDLTHRVENPLLNGIEIVRAGSGAELPEPSDDLARRYFDGSFAGEAAAAPSGGMDWSEVRAATVVDGELWYGMTDGTFHRRAFDGTSFGDDVPVDPYNDPEWSDVTTGSGQTFRGVRPGFYGELPTTTGLAFRDGQLYSTRAGVLYARGFSPESGVISGVRRTVAELPGIGGIFFSGDDLWFSDTVTGNLSRVAFADGAPSGAPTVVSGPAVDGVDWRSRTLFTGPGPQPPPPNQAPTASLTASCDGLTCTVDGTASSDPDGTVVEHAWDFGDGTTATGSTASHTYDGPGERTVTLEVTDDDGATATATAAVNPGEPANTEPTAVIAEPACTLGTCAFDGSGSFDSDGSIAEYAWDFGDGTTGSGPAASHAYTASGTYQVSLTVTDDRGATGSTSREVSVTVPAGEGIAFVGAAGAQAEGATSATVTTPATVQAGDALLLFVTVNNNQAGTVQVPDGWAQELLQRSQTMHTVLLSRVAEAGDGGSEVTVRLGATAKLDLQLAAYRGTSSGDPIRRAVSVADGGGPEHTSPVAAAEAGDWGVTYWADKSSSTTDWTEPAGTVVRGEQVGTRSGRVSSLLVDGGGPLPAGDYGGLVASTDVAGARATSLTVILAPR